MIIKTGIKKYNRPVKRYPSRKAGVGTVYTVSSFREADYAIDRLMDYFDANTNLQFSTNPKWIEAMLKTSENIINFYDNLARKNENHYYSNALAMIALARKNLQKGFNTSNFSEMDFYLSETFNEIYEINKFFKEFQRQNNG